MKLQITITLQEPIENTIQLVKKLQSNKGEFKAYFYKCRHANERNSLTNYYQPKKPVQIAQAFFMTLR